MKLNSFKSILDELETTETIDVPKNPFDKIIGQEHAVSLVRSAVLQRRHVLLCGVPGIGKSMLAKAASALLPKATQEIRIRNNPDQSNRPQVVVFDTHNIDEDTEVLREIQSRVYVHADALPFEIAARMGYRCPRCGHFSLPEQSDCIECGASKRFDWRDDTSYHGLLHTLNVVREPAEMSVTTQEMIGGIEHQTTYERCQHGTVRITKQRILTRGQSDPSVDTKTDHVLVSKDSSRFVQVSGTSPVELLGDVKHDPYGSAELLAVATPLRVVPGAIHEAHEGILYVDELAALGPFQKHLLTAMQDRNYPISGHNPQSSGAAVRVDGVPCDFILFASCNPNDLTEILQPLRSRIRGYGYEIMLSSWMEKTPDNMDKIAQFAAQTVVEDERIPHMTAQSVHAVLEIAEKLALETDMRRNALTLRLRKLGGIIRIAGDLAVQDGTEYVLPKHVVSAESLSRGVNLNQSNLFSQNPEQISQDYGSYFF